MSAETHVSVQAVTEQLRLLGVEPGGVLLVHTAFSKVAPVEGGPLGLIEALRGALGPRGTLVMPTMTDGVSVFDPASTPTLDMGVVAETFWRQPGVLRSGHPGGSFAAVGPHSGAICAPQPLTPPHGHDSPVGRVYDLDGQVLLLGVHHDASTTLHLAEALAEVPYRISYPCVVQIEGEVKTMMIPETDHCCMGFRMLDTWLGSTLTTGLVGHGEARLYRARDAVERALTHLRRDLLVFLCDPEAGCVECDAARRSTQ
ncbi:MAG: AAC(3) family N-acetyltransferase [Bradymonadia bacterium]